MTDQTAKATMTTGPLTTEMTVRLRQGVRPQVSGLDMKMTDAETAITADVLRQVADHIDEWADYVAAQAIAQAYRVEGAATFTAPDGGKPFTVESVSMQPAADDLFDRFQALRRSHRTDTDYQRVADTYNAAKAAGVSVREAVAAEFHVGKDRASQLIAGARDRGLLPPSGRTRKGSAK